MRRTTSLFIESVVFRAYWVLVIMDQCTRRIVGTVRYGLQCEDSDGTESCLD